MEIKRSTPDALKNLEIHLKALSGVTGKVGWFENAKYEDGTAVAYVAAVQELGWGPIPPRLGMRATAAAKQNEWSALSAQVANQVLKGNMTELQAMDVITEQAESDISEHIATVTSPPLSPVTLLARARKCAGGVINGTVIGELHKQAHSSSPDALAAAIGDVSTKPLIDTRHLFDTLNHIVEKN